MTDERLLKIAEILGTTYEYLTDQTDLPTPDTTAKRTPPTDADLKFALFNGASDATDEMLNEVRRYAAFIYHKEKQPTKV